MHSLHCIFRLLRTTNLWMSSFVVFKSLKMQMCFFSTLTIAIPTLHLLWKLKQIQLPFLDVLLSKQRLNNDECSCITSVLWKKSYTGLLTNYFSFTPFHYKFGLIKTLIDRAYKINNTTNSPEAINHNCSN